jgi:hypothetical protein
VDENDDLIDSIHDSEAEDGAKQTFPQMILENLKTAGVQQASKEDRITFTNLNPWPGEGRFCAEAWATLNSDTSRPFDKPKSGRIAVKVINHLGDEVMKVFRVI